MAYYFASDFHLGVDGRTSSREREAAIVRWIDRGLATDAEGFVLVGDLFEFWFEWKWVVPRGYVRLLGKLAEVTDRGLPLHIFVGNHDLWMRDYLTEEVGATIHRRPWRTTLLGQELLVAHGDGLGPGDTGYKRMKQVFEAPWANWLYGRLHPNLAMGAAYFFSSSSRKQQPVEKTFLGADREWLVAYSERKLSQDPDLDYCIFGHRHLPVDWTLSDGRARYINLGEWLRYQSFAKLSENGLETGFWERNGEQFVIRQWAENSG